MLSICITVKNRSRAIVDSRELQLFPNCVRSIVASIPPGLGCELVVADWESDDWPLKEWIVEAAEHVPLRLVTVQGMFNRGEGRNRAASAASGNYLLFLDADSLLCETVITEGMKHLGDGKAYFPVLFSFHEPEHLTGWWRQYGYGNCMVTRELFDLVGPWREYSGWGKEDDAFYGAVSNRVEVVREEVPGFYHQWHPDDVVWKDRYTSHYPHLIEESQKRAVVLNELEQFVAPGQKFILVDEAHFGSDPLPGRRSFPFLENHGMYWGPPPDDATAIRELERLRQDGARFAAFAWMTFWWMEFYVEFHQYLVENYACRRRTEHLLLFDLMERPEEAHNSK